MYKLLKEKLKDWAKKLSSGKKTEEKDGEEKKQKEKELALPMEFDVGRQKYEPDLEKLKEIELETKKPEEEKERGFFERISEKFTKVKISEKEFNIYAEELEMLLLENNVALDVSEEIIRQLKQEIIGKEFAKKEVEMEIKEALKRTIEEILIEPFDLAERIRQKNNSINEPFVILFCGINGTGKTTTIAKIASHLKENGISVVLAAADTFRAASIEQLKKHGDKIGVKVIAHDYGSDPAAVGFDAIKYAKKNSIQCVLIDTAGRMHTAKNLLREMEKIAKVCNPDLKIFVGESITGNDAIEQAKSFNWSIGIDGIVLSKADIDDKGGTALSVGWVTKKPILYLGTGQEYDSIEVFNKNKFIEKLGL